MGRGLADYTDGTVVQHVNRGLKIYDAAARRRGFITKDILIEDNSHE